MGSSIEGFGYVRVLYAAALTLMLMRSLLTGLLGVSECGMQAKCRLACSSVWREKEREREGER